MVRYLFSANMYSALSKRAIVQHQGTSGNDHTLACSVPAAQSPRRAGPEPSTRRAFMICTRLQSLVAESI